MSPSGHVQTGEREAAGFPFVGDDGRGRLQAGWVSGLVEKSRERGHGRATEESWHVVTRSRARKGHVVHHLTTMNKTASIPARVMSDPALVIPDQERWGALVLPAEEAAVAYPSDGASPETMTAHEGSHILGDDVEPVWWHRLVLDGTHQLGLCLGVLLWLGLVAARLTASILHILGVDRVSLGVKRGRRCHQQRKATQKDGMARPAVPVSVSGPPHGVDVLMSMSVGYRLVAISGAIVVGGMAVLAGGWAVLGQKLFRTLMGYPRRRWRLRWRQRRQEKRHARARERSRRARLAALTPLLHWAIRRQAMLRHRDPEWVLGQYPISAKGRRLSMAMRARRLMWGRQQHRNGRAGLRDESMEPCLLTAPVMMSPLQGGKAGGVSRSLSPVRERRVSRPVPMESMTPGSDDVSELAFPLVLSSVPGREVVVWVPSLGAWARDIPRGPPLIFALRSLLSITMAGQVLPRLFTLARELNEAQLHRLSYQCAFNLGEYFMYAGFGGPGWRPPYPGLVHRLVQTTLGYIPLPSAPVMNPKPYLVRTCLDLTRRLRLPPSPGMPPACRAWLGACFCVEEFSSSRFHLWRFDGEAGEDAVFCDLCCEGGQRVLPMHVFLAGATPAFDQARLLVGDPGGNGTYSPIEPFLPMGAFLGAYQPPFGILEQLPAPEASLWRLSWFAAVHRYPQAPMSSVWPVYLWVLILYTIGLNSPPTRRAAPHLGWLPALLVERHPAIRAVLLRLLPSRPRPTGPPSSLLLTTLFWDVPASRRALFFPPAHPLYVWGRSQQREGRGQGGDAAEGEGSLERDDRWLRELVLRVRYPGGAIPMENWHDLLAPLDKDALGIPTVSAAEVPRGTDSHWVVEEAIQELVESPQYIYWGYKLVERIEDLEEAPRPWERRRRSTFGGPRGGKAAGTTRLMGGGAEGGGQEKASDSKRPVEEDSGSERMPGTGEEGQGLRRIGDLENGIKGLLDVVMGLAGKLEALEARLGGTEPKERGGEETGGARLPWVVPVLSGGNQPAMNAGVGAHQQGTTSPKHRDRVFQPTGMAAVKDLWAFDDPGGRGADEMRLMTEQLKSQTAHLKAMQQRMSWVQQAAHTLVETARLLQYAQFIGGQPVFNSSGTAGLPDDALVFTMEQGEMLRQGERDAAFRFSTRLLVGPAILAYGGVSGQELSTRVEDFVPLEPGEERMLGGCDLHTFTKLPPREKIDERRVTLDDAYQRIRFMAYWLRHWFSPKASYELYLTAEEMRNCHRDHPNIFTPCNIMALVNRAIARHLAILRTRAAGMVGRCDEVSSPLTTAQREEYVRRQWDPDAPNLVITERGPYIQREVMQAIVEEQIRTFTVADPGRVAALVRGEPQRIKGSRAGMQNDEQSVGGVSTGLTLVQYQAAEAALRAMGVIPPSVKGEVCLRSWTAKGCPRGGRCQLQHPPLAKGHWKLLQSSKAAAVRAVWDKLGLMSQDKCAGLHPRTISGAEDGGDPDEAPRSDVSGARAPVRVPYLKHVGPCYPRAGEFVVEGAEASQAESLLRPATVHPDAPHPRLYDPAHLPPLLPCTLQRAGRPWFRVTPLVNDLFECHLESLVLEGREMGQDLETPHGTVANACVALTLGALLAPEIGSAADLANTVLAQGATVVHEVLTQLGDPTKTITNTELVVREMAHELLCPGHAVDVLWIAYFPIPLLAERPVIIIHWDTRNVHKPVAVDIVVTPTSTGAPLFCLQQRGDPGHLRPLWPRGRVSLPMVRQWALRHGVEHRTVTAIGAQQFMARDGVPTHSWNQVSHCGQCHKPLTSHPPAL